ncbi:MAG: heme A synthase [Myxococcales bacterium FL481]|nr:MAG: heme A synthase [Myxococcales bacterium FL481]
MHPLGEHRGRTGHEEPEELGERNAEVGDHRREDGAAVIGVHASALTRSPAACQAAPALNHSSRFGRRSRGSIVADVERHAHRHGGYERLAWLTVAFTVLVILFGAWVRITGSGAGCGQHWPTCHGEIIPRTDSMQTVIEFTHRLTSGVDGLLALALPILAWRLFPRGHATRRFAVISFALLIVEALLGAGLVVFELVEHDASWARLIVMPVHLTNTLLLLGAMVLTAWTSGGHPPPRWRGPAGRIALVGLVTTMVVSQLGAITALGDTVFPVLDAGLGARLADVHRDSSHLLERVRLVHPVIATAAALYLFYLPALLDRVGASAVGPWGTAVSVTVGVQLIAGLVNILLSAPGWMQLVHLALADGLWIALLLLAARATQPESTARPSAAA